MGQFLSKKDEVLEKIRESSNDDNLSENEFLKNFTDFYRRFITTPWDYIERGYLVWKRFYLCKIILLKFYKTEISCQWD